MKTVKSNFFEKTVKFFITIVMISTTALTVFGVVSYFYFTHDLPSIKTLKHYKPSTVTKIFSEEGEIICEFFYEKR
jgi:penicillin-binding protein 1A